MEKKTCVICGKEFVPYNSQQNSCSKECGRVRKRRQTRESKVRMRAKRRAEKALLPKRVCVICGKEFVPYNPQQKTCSKECSREQNRRMRVAYYHRHADAINDRTAARRRQAAVRSSGLTLAAAVEIDRLQDAGDVEALRKAAATWSKAERAYAKKRYESEHGLYGPLR